jgi:hypothetical protein
MDSSTDMPSNVPSFFGESPSQEKLSGDLGCVMVGFMNGNKYNDSTYLVR